MKIFLGGAPAPTDWRQSIAIPALTNAGYECVSPDQDPDGCDIYLFVLDRLARNVDTIVKACDAIYRGGNVVLVVMDMIPGTPIEGYMLSSTEARDLNIGRSALADFGTDAGCKVFATVESAVGYLVETSEPASVASEIVDSLQQDVTQEPVAEATPAPEPVVQQVEEAAAPELPTAEAPELPPAVEPEPTPEPPAPPAE